MALTIDGDAVRKLRKANGWTIRQFAEVARLSPGYLSKIETGKANGLPATMWQLADTLDVELAAITGDEDALLAAMRAAMRQPKFRAHGAQRAAA